MNVERSLVELMCGAKGDRGLYDMQLMFFTRGWVLFLSCVAKKETKKATQFHRPAGSLRFSITLVK